MQKGISAYEVSFIMAEYDGSIRINTKIESKDVTSQMQRIVNSIRKSESEIQWLQVRMDELANTKLPTVEYTKLQKELDTTIQKYEQVKDVVDTFSKIGTDPKATPFRMARDEAQELYMKIEEIRGAMFQLEETGKAFIPGSATEEYAKSAERVRELSDSIKVSEMRLSELQAKQMPISEGFKKMKTSVKKLASALGIVGTMGKKAFSALKNAAKNAFSSIARGSKTSNGLLSAFSERLKSIVSAVFVFNLIRTAFNSMVSQMKTGFSNFMNYSSDFANSIQAMKNAVSTFGNQVAAAFAPIVQLVIPWLTQLINTLSVAMSYVAQFFAALTGKSTFVRAKQVQNAYNSSLNDTASSAKKAYGALAKFDDLDVLQQQENTSGAGNAIAGAGDLFEEVPVDDRFADLVKWLKDMWENSDFYELGKLLGEKLKKALESIPWDEIKETAKKVGKSLASLINGFIEVKDLGYLIGKTLSEAMNTAFEFLNAFVHELHWASIGKFIAEELNGFFENIDWDLIRDTFVTGFKGLADSINSFIENFNWDNISETISNAINTIAETVYTFFTTVKWEKLGEELGKQLKETIEKIDWEEIGRSLGSIIQSALDFLYSFIGELDMGDIAQAFVDVLKGFFQEADVEDLANVILTIIAAKLAIQAITFGFGEVSTAIFGGIEASTTAAGVMTSTAEAASGLSLALEGLTSAFGVLKISVLAAAAASLLIDSHLDELGEVVGANQQQIDTLTNRYSGLIGKLNIVKDFFSLVGNAVDGFGFNASNTANQIGALETVMDSISEGTIYTDKQLEQLQERFGLTDEDIEMLRQSMLDANPALRDLADGFGLFDASAETLQDVQEGMKLIEDGTISASEAFGEFSKPMWGMNDASLSFFQNLSDGAITLNDYQSKIGETSEAINEFAASMEESGENIANGVTKGFEKADVQTPVQNFFDRVKSFFASVFDMHSPAKNMEPDGENIILGVLEGFKSKFSEFSGVVSELLQNINQFFSDTWTSIYENVVESWTIVQEWFTEYWALFTESLILVWNNIVLLFTETWENIQLLFDTFLEFLIDVFVNSWKESWETAQNLFQIFHDLISKLSDAIKNLFTGLMKSVKLLIDGNWKGAWENAREIFSAFKTKVNEIIGTIREILESFFGWISDAISGVLEKLSSIGSSIKNVFSGGGEVAGASVASASYASYSLDNIPHLASGSVIRGGNPFIAMLGDQPAGQTNIEAPISTIEQGLENVLNRRGYSDGGGILKVSVEIDGDELAHATVHNFLSELQRQGYNVDLLGVT